MNDIRTKKGLLKLNNKVLIIEMGYAKREPHRLKNQAVAEVLKTAVLQVAT